MRTEFDAVGINQTLHKIYLDINASIGILTPFGSFGDHFKSSLLLTQAVIIGEVPSTYYYFDSNSANETNAIELIE